jgi:adenosylcobinamide-phosphate synthase
VFAPAALALDIGLGVPRWLPHPVRAIGTFVAWGERRLWTGRSRKDREHGMLLAIATVAGSALAAAFVLVAAARMHPLVGAIAAAVVAWTTIALRGLADAGRAVANALEAGDLDGARRILPALVGRDPEPLDEHGIARAAIESVAENASDGVVAPLFYLVIGGPVGAVAYKAINTLDSMIGHRDERYRDFGRFAARLDDVANWLPARLTAACLVVAAVAGGSPRGAASTAWRDARRHASPNAGWPEAAVAGALGLRLGGPVAYGGEVDRRAWLGRGAKEATAAHVRVAVRLLWVASGIAVAALLAGRAIVIGSLS